MTYAKTGQSKRYALFTYDIFSKKTHIRPWFEMILLNLNCVRSISEYIDDEYQLRPEGMSFQTRWNVISDRRESRLRPEEMSSQTGRKVISDRQECHLRPEGMLSKGRLRSTLKSVGN